MPLFERARRLLAPLVAWLLLPLTATAQDVEPTKHPFLWRIEGDPPSYLYGTMHVGDPRITTLPEVVEDALYSSDALYTELAFDDMLSEVATEMFLPGDRTLRDELPEELFDRLQAVFEAKGVPFRTVSKMRVWAVHLFLQTLDYQDELAAGQPLDMFLYDEARNMGMEVGGLETVEEQLAVFRDYTDEEQLELLEATVSHFERAIEDGTDAAEEMVEAYLSGVDDALFSIVEKELAGATDVEKRMYERLLPERNVRMAKRIAEKIRASPDRQHFFAVGCAHMPGGLGLLALLRDEGFEITRIAPPEPKSIEDVIEEIRGLRREIEDLKARVTRLEKRRFF